MVAEIELKSMKSLLFSLEVRDPGRPSLGAPSAGPSLVQGVPGGAQGHD